MKRLAFVTMLLLVVGTAAGVRLAAQEPVSAVTISTEPGGVTFLVDGRPYIAPTVFLWPRGSKHTLIIEPVQPSPTIAGSRYTFRAWVDSTGLLNTALPSISVTADPSVTAIKAQLNLDYQVNVQFASCDNGLNCNSPGTVSVAGTPFAGNGQIYLPAGATVQLAAFPNPGYVFQGWNLPGSNTAFITSFVLRTPTLLAPVFAPAKSVTLETSPRFLEVLVDRTPTPTPATVDWAFGSKHLLSATSPQTGEQGGLWVFDSWSHGGGQNTIYDVLPGNNLPVTLTANFVPGARASFVTQPVGLKLNVDGRDNWPGYNFVWAVGSTHQVTAPAEQADSNGRRYKFVGWSNTGTASQNVTMDQATATTGFRIVATYEALSRVTVESAPVGLSIQVDGIDCRTPCVLDRDRNAQVSISTPQMVGQSDTMRQEFIGWVDGGPRERVVLFDTDYRLLRANYTASYRLVTAADPFSGALLRLEPGSPDGFYRQNTPVSVTAAPKPGHRFRRWEGDLAGTYSTGVVSMEGPRSVRALLDMVPYVDPAGARNAAGSGSEPGVAAGSIVSLFGVHLAADTEVGPASPLSQSLAGVTVRLANRLLPLFFVSPDQINLQVPTDLPEGSYRVFVQRAGQADTMADLLVVRNAPGLFTRVVEGRAFALVLHEDGSPVTSESPARRGETVSLLGTGFGPYERHLPDGFAVPAELNVALVDTVELVAGDAILTPLFAGAAPGFIGANVARFRVGDNLPAASTVELKVRVNGRLSNTVLFPVE